MKHIQIFSPHPDDSDIFVGGTLLRHLAEGDQVEVVLMTRGEEGTPKHSLRGEKIAKIREAEVYQRHALIPEVHITWQNFQDCQIEINSAAVLPIKAAITAWMPDIIYLPETDNQRTLYGHQDHVNTGKLIENALQGYPKPVTLRYYHSTQPNLFIDVTNYLAATHASLKFYRSQWGRYLPWLLYYVKAMRYFYTRRYGRRINCKHAEAFREVLLNSSQK